VGIAKGGSGGRLRWSLGLPVFLLGLVAAPLPAAELQEAVEPEATPAESSDLTVAGGAGVDIRIADLLAGGSVLAGVLPRPATSGIGADLERDLFESGAPLNVPDSSSSENDPSLSY
jgi:hypothetical protein